MTMDLSPIIISLKTATLSIIITFFLGVAAAQFVFRLKSKTMKTILDGLFTLPLVLPPTVAGFFLLYIFGMRRPIGKFLIEYFAVKIAFSWGATVLAAVVISFPLMYRSARGAFEQVNPDVLSAGRTLGMSEWNIFWKVQMPIAWPGVISGAVLAFARGLGEFGATAMIAGNIRGKTRTLPLAVYSAVASGKMDDAGQYVVILVGISFIVVVCMNYFLWKRKARIMALSVHIKKKLKDFELAVDFDMDEGIVGFLGSSGCGKSMTLKCIAGIETPDEGRIVLDDEVLFDKKSGINLSPQKRKVGYLFQNYALFPHMTVKQNIEAGLAASGKSKQEKKEIVERLLEQFHIKELENSYPVRISGGQQQRAALARMMAAEPKFLLLDEPFSALDAYLKEKLMQEMMTYLNQFKKGVIMVSHSRDEVYQMCSDTVIMHQGMIETLGKTKEIFDNPGTVNAARLTGCKNISRATKTGTHEVYASDWDIKLTFPEQIEIPSNLTHVGIRAHEIHPIVSKDTNLKDMDSNESIKLNTMDCQLERISEAPFEMYLILQNKSGKNTSPLWWKVTKKEWQEIGERVPETVELPAEHIILLK